MGGGGRNKEGGGSKGEVGFVFFFEKKGRKNKK
jgi:hypothetical protein